MTCHAMRQSVSIGTHQTGVSILFSDKETERTAWYVVTIQSYMYEMNAIFTRHKPHSIAI